LCLSVFNIELKEGGTDYQYQRSQDNANKTK